ncbi:MAG: ArsA family ATPase [Candidatus Binataceae bacterium]
MNPALKNLLERRLVICAGPGGVGKTTVSAALALAGARLGRAVDVMTIDPAPRLLDALGLDTDDPDLQEVPLGAYAQGPRSRLRALRLDPKHTFDRLVRRYAPSPSARDAILENRIYQNVSAAMAGVADYMAIERLLEMHQDDSSDLIVLDTPPAREALDFLDSPRRLLDLLNSRAVGLLSASSSLMRGGAPIVDMAARAVLAAFDRVTGLHLLRDVRKFVQSFDGMYSGFAARAERARCLLQSAEAVAVIVTTAELAPVEQVQSFAIDLNKAGVHIGAVVVNRTFGAMPRAAALARTKVSPGLKRKLARNLRDFRAWSDREALALKALEAVLPAGAILLAAPELATQPRALKDLAEIGERVAEI